MDIFLDVLTQFFLPLLVVFGLGFLLYKMFLKEQERTRKQTSDFERLVNAVESISSYYIVNSSEGEHK